MSDINVRGIIERTAVYHMPGCLALYILQLVAAVFVR